MITVILLTLLAVLAIYDTLGPLAIQLGRPLMTGAVAGVIVGDPVLGMAIGATLELTALGVYQYGGSTIPDYPTGAIVGVAIASSAGGDLSTQMAVGLGVGIPAAVLLAALDPIGRFLATFALRRAETYAMAGDARGLARMHVLGFVPWALVRAIPAFLGALAATSGQVQDVVDAIPQGFVDGMGLAGALLPAVGFAMLLTFMPIKKYWFMLLLGFTLFAYLEVPLLGIALVGLAVAAAFYTFQRNGDANGAAAGGEQESASDASEAGPTAVVTRADLARSFRRFILGLQISWNYERMQGLGFAYAMEPALRRIYPDEQEYRDGLVRHLQFFNSSPVVGAPLILGSAVALEEAGAPTSANSIKVAMMGPLAGIGDTLTFAIYNSIIFTIGASLALDGNWLGPALVAVLVFVPYLLVRRWQFYTAHRQGMRLASRLAAGALGRFSDAASVLGLVVLGGFIPSIVQIVTTLSYEQNVQVEGETVTQEVAIQEQLDTILPYMLPVAVTAAAYVLLRRLRNPVWVIAIIGVAAVALGWFGWFAPSAPEPVE